MSENRVFNKVLIPETKTAVQVTLKEMPTKSFIGYIEGYIPTTDGMLVSVVVCDLGALTCVNVSEIIVLNRDNPVLAEYVPETRVRMPKIID